MKQIALTIKSLKSINFDANKKIASELKKMDKPLLDSDVLVLSEEEPGRCWVKKAGRVNCAAYG